MQILRTVAVPGHSQLPTGPAPATRQSRSGTAAIAGTAVIAILAVLVVVLSYRVGHRTTNEVSLADLSAVEARVDALAGQMAVLRKNLHAVAAQRKPFGL